MTMTDLLEHRLAEAGRRWQAAQPPAPEVPVDRLTLTPRRRPRYAWAAAAAVLVIVGGTLAVAAMRPGPNHPSPGVPPPWVTSTHQVGPVVRDTVPWAALPATHPHLRSWPQGHHRPWSTPYDLVSVAGEIKGRVHPGDTLAFTAYLESSTDLPLDPCPDINIALGTHAYYTWQLNCAAVPYIDSAGHPYLPAFTKVPFRIEATVPEERGRQKVLFTIDGPQQMPGFFGLIDVVTTR
jgi:hypothetical protein